MRFVRLCSNEFTYWPQMRVAYRARCGRRCARNCSRVNICTHWTAGVSRLPTRARTHQFNRYWYFYPTYTALISIIYSIHFFFVSCLEDSFPHLGEMILFMLHCELSGEISYCSAFSVNLSEWLFTETHVYHKHTLTHRLRYCNLGRFHTGERWFQFFLSSSRQLSCPYVLFPLPRTYILVLRPYKYIFFHWQYFNFFI